jgi:hypothetical protein
MIRRLKTNSQTPLSSREKDEVWKTTHFIVERFYSGNEITDLERDFVLYVKKSMWHSAKWSFFSAFATVLGADLIGPFSRLRFPVRLGLKLLAAGLFVNHGINQIKADILQFPVLEPLVVSVIIRHSTWIELRP